MSIITQPNSKVKTYPWLNAKAIEIRKTGIGRIMYLARSLDETGRGSVPKAPFLAFLSDNDICTPRTFARIMSQAKGELWEADGRIYYRSLEKVAAKWGCPVKWHPVKIELRYFKTQQSFRAALLASLYAHKEPQWSLAGLGNLINRSPRTISTYHKVAGVESTTNLSESKHRPEASTHAISLHLEEQGYFAMKTARGWLTVKRLSSTRSWKAETCPFGQSKSIASSSSTKGALRRIYFDDPTTHNRAVQSLLPGEHVYLSQRPNWWHEWTRGADHENKPWIHRV